MSWYQLTVVLHLLAMCIWFGHMFFWTLVIGPVTNRLTPETGQTLRQVSLRLGGLG
jgi:putative copper export protein